MSVNKAILVGRLGRDPETRYTSGGQAVANFTLATDETFKDRAGERQKRTTTEIVGNVMRMLTSRAEGAAAGASAGGGSGAGTGHGRSADADFDVAGPAIEEPSAGPEISDEDIPF